MYLDEACFRDQTSHHSNANKTEKKATFALKEERLLIFSSQAGLMPLESFFFLIILLLRVS